ncbi:hypothetical protein A4S06_11385 [Erysipelotrichaceae bacterium MTC7]|nr:hypothetical protein A4S06_11385 [Erysipelotrichaceae bacterium MTC7]
MSKNRLEAFSDAIIAIVMTIMVLELQLPKEPTFAALFEMRYTFLVYLISFASLAIYWNNHHHMFQAARKINGRVLWANMLFIFLLTLVPFATRWVDEHLFDLAPELFYATILMLSDIAYALLLHELVRIQDVNSPLVQVRSGYTKLKITITLNVLGILLGVFISPIWIMVMYVVALLPWVIPSKKIEKMLD